MAESKGMTLRVMFEDEARFGRIQELHRCWARKGHRLLVGQQLVREYTYSYGVVSPQDGRTDFLILPKLNSECYGIFLLELSKRYWNEYLLIFCDGASAHTMTDKDLPVNIMLRKIPAYWPVLNPVENLWDDMREKWFKNKIFKSMDDVECQLVKASLSYENSPELCKSIPSFPWMVYN